MKIEYKESDHIGYDETFEPIADNAFINDKGIIAIVCSDHTILISDNDKSDNEA